MNSAMKHSLQFAVNTALFEIFGSLSTDTYKDICKHFRIWPTEEQISVCQGKLNLRYCSFIGKRAVSKLR